MRTIKVVVEKSYHGQGYDECEETEIVVAFDNERLLQQYLSLFSVYGAPKVEEVEICEKIYIVSRKDGKPHLEFAYSQRGLDEIMARKRKPELYEIEEVTG